MVSAHRLLVIDHQDSYTYNLVDLMATISATTPTVVEHREITAELVAAVRAGAYTHVVVSPGPGTPTRTQDFGATADIIRAAGDIPVLGVCLGLQGLAMLHGATIDRLPHPAHGQVCAIQHSGEGIFCGIRQPTTAVRYHSLQVTDLPQGRMRVHARTEDDVVMALNVLDEQGGPTNHWAVQYHPESVLTGHGPDLIRNFLALGDTAPSGSGSTCQSPVDSRSASIQYAQSQPAHQARPEYRFYHRQLNGYRADTAATFARLRARARTPDTDVAIWLDTSAPSSAGATGPTRSILAAHIGPLSQVVRYRATDEQLWVLTGSAADAGNFQQLRGNVLEYLQDHHLLTDATDLSHTAPGPVGFRGGWLGYFGYEAWQHITPGLLTAPRHRSQVPDGYWLRPQCFTVIEPDTVHLYAIGDPRLLDDLHQDLVPLGPQTDPPPAIDERLLSEDSSLTPPGDTGSWQLGDEQYLQAIDRIQEHLAAGDAYEVCLTDTYTQTVPEQLDTFALYCRLRQANPAPYSGYLCFDCFAGLELDRFGRTDHRLEILCSSPERFLTISKNAVGERIVESKPIKGTVARSADPERDRQIIAELATDEKTRAENLMIVDLLRHDLSRVAEPGTVRVPQLMNIETYATVHQMVSTITGRLAPQTSVAEVLEASFPGGSMTGAPKVRSLEIIDALEAGARGVYSGTIGWLGTQGEADLNIVIRTLVRHGSRVSIGAGGAIVADSNPRAELAERNLKAQVLITALNRAVQETTANSTRTRPKGERP
ncbi:chorismate-binding protein [Auritidibacter ignavus]|uniref:chorismate-binding protein n=1 Tax=Auritidibacter ignavus TaxID=678932 RepID=UPI002448D879|nr:chorismate-binding protein [Auritidibacter ignavus]WGH89827.1 chorismate-binding protein [Auritidibacter ignavus]WHS27221.1 chorismate-binding protein [Auritidibacter ignavus]